MTTPLGGGPIATGTSAVASTAAPKKAGDSAMGPDAFMKLLVAQLKYQNPMAPTDGQQYMTQMATFTQVEKLDQLVKAQTSALQWQQRVSAEGMVGRSVSGTTDGVATTGTVVGVRYAGTTATLQFSDGRTLDASLVDRVEVAGTTPPATTPPATHARHHAGPDPRGHHAGHAPDRRHPRGRSPRSHTQHGGPRGRHAVSLTDRTPGAPGRRTAPTTDGHSPRGGPPA